ncbi:MAG: alkaline phosphatase family protein [Bauldia sp.]
MRQTVLAQRLIAILLALTALVSGAAAGPPIGAFKKVFVVVLENTDYELAIRQDFLGRLARRGGLLANFHDVGHPSQPNYIAMIAGDRLGVTGDDNVTLNAPHLADRLEARGLDWKVYAEGFPGKCFLGARSGRYVRKHVPFLSFASVQHDPKRCARIVSADTLDADIRANALPAFSLYVPDLRNDGHDTGVQYADRWLAGRFGPLLQRTDFMKDILLVVTFDEASAANDHIATILLGDSIRPGSRSDTRYDHYALLKLIVDGLQLRSVGPHDAVAPTIDGVWR